MAKRDDLVRGDEYGKRRLGVADGSICFDAGRQYRVSHEFTETPFVIKVEAGQDFSIRKQSISLSAGGVRFRAFRGTQGTPGGSFTTVIDTVRSNNLQGRDLDGRIEITKGGTFTPSQGQTATETIRVIAAGATAQRTTVGASKDDLRNLPAGGYYLMFDTLGNTGGQGVYDLEFSLLTCS
jgi:hypothetical protein